MKLTSLQKRIVAEVKRMQPVSAMRAGITKRQMRAWNQMIDDGILIEVSRGMLGANYQLSICSG